MLTGAERAAAASSLFFFSFFYLDSTVKGLPELIFSLLLECGVGGTSLWSYIVNLRLFKTFSCFTSWWQRESHLKSSKALCVGLSHQKKRTCCRKKAWTVAGSSG